MTSFEAFELQIAVNYPAHLNGEWQSHAKSHELISAFWLVLLTEHCYATNAVYHCLVAG